MIKIELKPNQIKLLNRWLIKQTYLKLDEVVTFKQFFREYGLEIKESDFDMVYECCPFGFVINKIDDYDLQHKKGQELSGLNK